MTRALGRDHLLCIFGAWWLVFIALSGTGIAAGLFTQLCAGVALFVAPGLATIAALRLYGMARWSVVMYMLCFSLVELMLVGVIHNAVFLSLGVARPLGDVSFLGTFSLFMTALVLVAWMRNPDARINLALSPRRAHERDTRSAVGALSAPLVSVALVFLSVVGAISLNNGGTNEYTLAMIALAAGYAAYLMCNAQRYERQLPLALFVIGLSFLLMTSLRGWYIVGHDIQREFAVFEITKTLGYWSMENYRDAYNACLSITILPTIIASLVRIPDIYVYKFAYQIIFAVVPGAVYMLAARYVRPSLAFASALFFIAFPTFFTDMPFLCRQEIALVFFAGMLVALFDDALPRDTRRLLVVIFGVGMALSHYSTTYLVVGLVWLTLVLQFVSLIAVRMDSVRRFLERGGVAPVRRWRDYTLTVAVGVILFGASFVWSVLLTDTSSESLGAMVRAVAQAMRDAGAEDARSSDVNYSLLSGGQDMAGFLSAYDARFVVPVREREPEAYFAPHVYADYPVAAARPAVLPDTYAGALLARTGIDPLTLNGAMRQGSAKLLQAGMLVGLVGVFFTRRTLVRRVDMEFVLIALSCVAALALFTVAPVFSVAYGVLRLFQQSLMVTGIFIGLGGTYALFFVSEAWRVRIVCGFALVVLLSTSGAVPELLGGYYPQLHLNNAGEYYDQYYTRRGDELAFSWLSARGIDDVQMQQVSGPRVFGHTDAVRDNDPANDIYPGLVRQGAYVYVSPSILETGHATALYDGSAVAYEYPLTLLDDTKDAIYVNGESRIYK